MESNITTYHLQFEKLCKFLNLGELLSTPQPLTGGHMHRMYSIQTTSGKFAVKALNPQIMIRPSAMQNYINSERIANFAAKNIPAAPAKIFDSVFMPEIEGQFYLVFDWIEGICLMTDKITLKHCEKIGYILAGLHQTDFSSLGLIDNYSSDEVLTDWNHYMQKGMEANAEWFELLKENIDNLYQWNNQLIHSAKQLASDTVISHMDLEPKNVMWRENSPVIIDWEASGFIHPMHDLVETALYWSVNSDESIDKDKFTAFIKGYKSKYSAVKADWQTVLEKGFGSKLGWLEYSLKRSLGIECADEAEQQMGTEHTIWTIHSLLNYASRISEYKKWLEEIK